MAWVGHIDWPAVKLCKALSVIKVLTTSHLNKLTYLIELFDIADVINAQRKLPISLKQ